MTFYPGKKSVFKKSVKSITEFCRKLIVVGDCGSERREREKEGRKKVL